MCAAVQQVLLLREQVLLLREQQLCKQSQKGPPAALGISLLSPTH